MTLETLQAKVRYLLGELTSSSYSDTNLNRAINNYYQKAVVIAMENMGQWDVQSAVATTNLVASQQDYQLPSDLLYITRVEANFEDGTYTWNRMDSIDERQLGAAISNYTVDGASSWFRLYNDSIYLENPPETAVSNGLKIFYTEEVTALSDSADTIVIPEHLSDYLIFGACLEYKLRIEDNDGYTKYTRLINENAENIKKYYSNRLKEKRQRITTRVENYE